MTAQYDDYFRQCPHCHQYRQFEFSLGFFRCSFCGGELTIEEFEATRDPAKLPVVGAPEGSPRQRPDEGMPPPDVPPLDEFEIPDGY